MRTVQQIPKPYLTNANICTREKVVDTHQQPPQLTHKQYKQTTTQWSGALQNLHLVK